MGKYVEELVTSKLQEIKSRSNEYEVGRVMSVREYILEVSGLENACFYDNEKERIVMYYSGTIDRKALKQNLKGLVPEYMVPGKIIQKDVLPHNLHGKIDRRELKEEMKGL